MGLMSSRELDLKNVFNHELAPVPTSLFEDSGDMRLVKSKATVPAPDVIVLDGCAIMWIIHWPGEANVKTYVDAYVSYVLARLITCHVILVFDRYYDHSIKSATRKSRAGKHASRKHILTLDTPLPPQLVVLTVTENKTQLIQLLYEQIVDAVVSRQLSESVQNKIKHTLIMTVANPVPDEVSRGIVIPRRDMATTHEEADVIMIQQIVSVATSKHCIKVICDDTDVFALLAYYYQ